MDGAVEFNLLHCIAGVVLAVGCGFVVDHVCGQPRSSGRGRIGDDCSGSMPPQSSTVVSVVARYPGG
jgi:hypothetical protein